MNGIRFMLEDNQNFMRMMAQQMNYANNHPQEYSQ